MFRTFTLQNSAGETYPLSSSNPNDFYTYGFLTEPEGLGIEFDNEYVRLGDIFLRTESEIDQGEFEGTMNFANYTSFRNFGNYIFRSHDLVLIYTCSDAEGTYYRDCDIVSIEKGEIGDNGIMECPVTFSFKSLYYEKNEIKYLMTDMADDRRYTFSYPCRFYDYQALDAPLVNDGHTEASISIYIYGYCENPEINITDENGDTVYTIKFNHILQDGDRIEYSSKDGNSYIRLVTSDGTVTSLVSEMPLTNNNFIRLPIGTYYLTIASDTDATNRMSYILYKFFKVV